MNVHQRKSDPKIIGGKPLRVTNQRRTLQAKDPNALTIERANPGRGFRHLVSRRDIIKFLRLLPDWEEIALGLDTIVLSKGSLNHDGWYRCGMVGLSAWEHDFWRTVSSHYFEEHRELLNRIGVVSELRHLEVLLKFSPSQAKAFQLLHVLLHELGHHHDLMTTPSKSAVSRGEAYAEQYANEYTEIIWHQYICFFGL